VSGAVRSRIRVEGIVQGVGFRPFVHALASEAGLSGFVGNDSVGVFIEAEGPPEAVARFVEDLRARAPTLAVVDRVASEPIAPLGGERFEIMPSTPGTEADALVSPDSATCADCLAELADPSDRRYGYAFVNCTNCGPRFTIVRRVPYDRDNTTMAGFVMCGACRREYEDPSDRRFHAQPTCCPDCGPSLRLVASDGRRLDGDPVAATAELLGQGSVVAIKGLGGFHLAADATQEGAVERLRSRKHREERPFAVMVRDLEAARRLAEVDDAEAALLTGPERPIVLVRRRARPDPALSVEVAPRTRELGLLLPYTPLHHLLAAGLDRPFVLTSGNVSDEPIAYLDDDAVERLAGIADAFLLHDRPIATRTDDSVLRVALGSTLPIRRSRGFTPRPLEVPIHFRRPVLAVGAELKSTFCLGKGTRALVSHHIGDLENYETFRSFSTGVTHLCDVFGVAPSVVAHDLHPDYLSTKYALDLEASAPEDNLELVGVQHHHAHIASCLAENGSVGPVLGVALDGAGFGPDGTIWGGELLVADLAGFERVGRLAPVPMPGGASAVRQPWRMAAAYADAALGAEAERLEVARRHGREWAEVVGLSRSRVSCQMTSSAGRLFDAVAALLGVRDVVTYEGQAAVELEQLADPLEAGRYPMGSTRGRLLELSGAELVAAVATDLAAGVEPPLVAARFHNGFAAAVAGAASELCAERRLRTVALSGGVFQNVRLLTALVARLRSSGLEVLTHSRVPPNDGGISLGQAAVAAARGAT